MNGNYSGYLLAVVLIVAAVVVGFIYLARAGAKGRGHKGTRPVPVAGGSVSAFFDKKGNVAIIPYVKGKFGTGRATQDIAFLTMPYNPGKLGAVLRSSLNSCQAALPCTDQELLEKLEARDWMGFSADKRNISVYFKENYGIIFNTTRRRIDGAYEFNHDAAEKSLPPDTDDETLGSTALLLLEKCR